MHPNLLKGLADFVTAFNGDAVDKKGFWWLENKAGSYIPNILTKVMDDPFIREQKVLWMSIRKD